MYEATFRIDGTSAYAAITADIDAQITLWCNDHADLLSVRCPDTESDAICERIETVAGIDDTIDDGTTLMIVTTTCVKESATTTVDPLLERHGCLLLAPLQYEHGTRLCRVLALDSQRLSDLYESLREEFAVTVESKRRLETVDARAQSTGPLDSPTVSLTARQRAVFKMAHENGYYRLPRETTMEDVAAEIGIDRRTADEHRRRAEQKLLDALAARLV